MQIETKDLGPHKFGCLMAVLPDDIRKQITDFGIEQILDCHLAEKGLEVAPHTTILYGFTQGTDEIMQDLRAMLVRNGPIQIKMVGLSLFTGNEDGSVLKIDVESPELHELHSALSATFPNKDKYDTYLPHITIGYLVPEYAEQYSKPKPDFIGRSFVVDTLEWSSADNERELIYLSFLNGIKAMPEENGRWVTIDGTHVFINGSGEVIKGPSGLEGKPLDAPKTKNNESKNTPQHPQIPDKQTAEDNKPQSVDELLIASAQTGTAPAAIERARKYLESLGTPPPPPKKGYTRLYRGTLIGETPHENSYFVDERGLAGVAIPFARQSGRELVYVDVPDEVFKANDLTGGAVTEGEALLPEEYRKQAKHWGTTNQKSMSYLSETSGGALVAPAKQPKSLVFDPEGIKLLRNKYKRRRQPAYNEHAEKITNVQLVGLSEKSFEHVKIKSALQENRRPL